MAIRLVIFDLAGTTVRDPDGVGSCLKAALDTADIPWDDDSVRSIMGIPKPQAIEDLIRWAGEVPSATQIESIHRDFQRRMIAYYENHPDVGEIPGATHIFRALRNQGIKVALDTGFDRSIVNVLLRRLGWGDDLIDATATSDEVANGRPHPDLVYRLMELTEVESPKDVAKVGDTASDLREGEAAGCGLLIGVTTGAFTREELQMHPHTHILDSLAELLPLLQLAEAGVL